MSDNPSPSSTISEQPPVELASKPEAKSPLHQCWTCCWPVCLFSFGQPGDTTKVVPPPTAAGLPATKKPQRHLRGALSLIAEETESTILLECDDLDRGPGASSAGAVEAATQWSTESSSTSLIHFRRPHPNALAEGAALVAELAWRVVASLLLLGWLRDLRAQHPNVSSSDADATEDGSTESADAIPRIDGEDNGSSSPCTSSARGSSEGGDWAE